VDETRDGDGHRLDCNHLSRTIIWNATFNGPFDSAVARACREELQKKIDLSQYTTPQLVDDIDEIRAAMGYDKINLNGGSSEPMPRNLHAASSRTCAERLTHQSGYSRQIRSRLSHRAAHLGLDSVVQGLPIGTPPVTRLIRVPRKISPLC